ncbi:MAG: TonB-dependent receptor plug domain-containing protein, partial [Bacteroidota bacterium]
AGQLFAPEQLEQLDVYLSPNAAADPLKAIQNTAGATVTDETANPVLRGSGAGRNRVLFNGVPIRNPVRNSTINGLGYFSIFSPEFVDRLDVYPSTPPLSRAATAGGLIDLHSVNSLAAEQTQISVSLAAVGGYLSREIGGDEKHFVQVYVNHQLSDAFKAINGNRFDFLEDFHNTNIGFNYHRSLGKYASLNVFSSAMREGSQVAVPFLNYEGMATNETQRWFNVVNLRYFRGKTAVSLNSGTNFNAPEYRFGVIEADYREANLHHALYVDHYLTDAVTLRGGAVLEHHDYHFNNQYPLHFFAFDPSAPSSTNDTTIQLRHPELVAYVEWQLGKQWEMGAGLRKNAPLRGQTSYLAKQASVRFNPGAGHTISLGAGEYFDYFTPNVNVQSFELLSSRQAALEYGWKPHDDFSLSLAAYHKTETGLVDLGNPQIGEMVINGLELGVRGKVGRRLSYFLNLTHLDKQIRQGETLVPARDDLDYLLGGGFQYLHEKLGAFSLTVTARPGLRYTPIVGADFVEAAGTYRPRYSGAVNGAQLADYRRISFGYSRTFRLGPAASFLGFVNLNNLENRANEQNRFFNEDYSERSTFDFPGLALYFGGVFSF